MHIAFFCTSVPDNCGAFYSDLCLARELRSRGHTITLIDCSANQRNFGGGVFEGFPWKPYPSAGKELDLSQLWMGPHYPNAPIVRRLNLKYRRPVIFTLHFAGAPDMFRFLPTITWKETFWYVNPFIPQRLLNNQFPSWVVHHEYRHPFLEKAPILVDTPGQGDCITLVNANINKGLEVFLKIAKALPEKKFLGIISYYHIPHSHPNLEVPPNIEWIPFTRDMKRVYARTRILLVPSAYESFCMVAAEALVNGIPVLYTKPYLTMVNNTIGSTEGMDNWLNAVGLPCDRSNETEWVTAINSLDDPETYSKVSEASKAYAEPFFGTARDAADAALRFAAEHPVQVGEFTKIRNDPAPKQEVSAGPTMAQLTQRPSHPASWRGGRLSFARR